MDAELVGASVLLLAFLRCRDSGQLISPVLVSAASIREHRTRT